MASVIDQMIKAGGLAPAKDYCNVLAAQLGLDPNGHAATFDDMVLIETPLPWHKSPVEMTGVMPAEFIELMNRWLDAYHAGQPYNHRPLLIAPDPTYSVPGLRTVIFYARPQQPFARFAKMEYRVPDAALGPLVWAWYMAPERLGDFDRYRHAEADALRDLLVCTHGTVDVACAKFGFPLYQTLRQRYSVREQGDAPVRVWRVSHFGGHVFAPTLADMPSGHYWAYVGDEQAAQIATRTGDVAALKGHYRGWAGVESGFMQAAEAAMWQAVGWTWFDAAKQGELVDCDPGEEPQWAVVRVPYALPDGGGGVYTAHVIVREIIETTASTGVTKPRQYEQYAVTRLTHTPN